MMTRGHKRAETIIFGHVTNRSVMGITHRCGKGRTWRRHSGVERVGLSSTASKQSICFVILR
jgi:hypothetical protein